MKKWTVDRIEEHRVIVECDGILLEIPRTFLPLDTAEGDVLSIQKDESEQSSALDEAKARLDRLKA
jgi:hypothetical protein